MIAGEASGDLHGAGVVRELKRRDPSIEVFGVGGDRMREAGMDLVYHVNEISVMGFAEILTHLPVLASVRKTLEQLLVLKKPDTVVLIDYPGFNLRFARAAKRRGTRVLYYISPQVWAWHRSRVRAMRGIIDKMLVVFPFEEELYRREGIDVEFVGHPLVEVLETRLSRREFERAFGFSEQARILALLPGSRRQEIERIFPPMLASARRIAEQTGMEIGLGVAPTLDERWFRVLGDLSGVRIVRGGTYELMRWAEFALVTSGTATLETGWFGTPMFVLYKTSWLTYLLGRLLIRIRTIGLVNIVAGSAVVPEFIQHRARPSVLVPAALGLLEHSENLRAVRDRLSVIRTALGKPGAAGRVADAVLGTV
jgi:lipid-A-disaccharide synthase